VSPEGHLEDHSRIEAGLLFLGKTLHEYGDAVNHKRMARITQEALEGRHAKVQRISMTSIESEKENSIL